MKFRHLLLVVACLVVPSFVHAQMPNCSKIRYQFISSVTTSKAGCDTLISAAHYDMTWTFNWQCITVYPLAQTQYASETGMKLTESGSCWGTLFGVISCDPRYIVTNTSVATAPSTNQLNWQAYIGSPAPGTPTNCTQNEKGAVATAQCAAVGCTQNPGVSPVVIDLDGRGFSLTDAADGVSFDIAGNGTPVKMGWTAKGADNGFLALPGPDGLVHNGTQLFGNFTPQPPSDFPNGFAALAVYDDPKNGGNGDDVIDKRDAVWASLRIWVDVNHDGKSTKDEMFTLDSLGVNSISLDYKLDNKTDPYGNMFRFSTRMNPDHPDRVDHVAYDVFFVTACN